ncbi:MAG: hypothetical protein HY721_14750 [Planctomycetes bacterium]|nr:hypothetical protein [Planctomycetota bacterium]
MARMVLEFHGWRETKPDDDNELKALFLFTLMTAAERQSGVKPDHTKAFWTEVRLSRDLASRGRWGTLSRDEKIKAMFRFAVERIQEAGRNLREAPMFWTTQSRLGEGPPWDLSGLEFPKPHAVAFEVAPLAESPSLQARKAAGMA